MSQSSPSLPPPAYASIMVPMGLDPQSEATAKLATALADRFASRLIGVAAQQVAAPLYFEAPTAGVASIIELEERRIAEDLVKIEAVFRAIVGSRSRVEWRQSVAFPTSYVLEQAGAADLIVVARPQRDRRALDALGIDGGYLVMDAGRPVLFVPPNVEYLSAKRIVIGWKDVREARRAVCDGLALLTRAEEIFVVSSGGDVRGAQDVRAYLGYHGIDAHILAPPVSPAGSTADELVRIAQGEGADLIVCGAYGHNRAREWVFGGVTHDLLHHSPLCCLMSH